MKMIGEFVSPEHPMFTSCVRAFLPRTVKVAFRQWGSSECSCALKVGDVVTEGQTIATCTKGSLGADVHSPVPGRVLSISRCTLPDGTLGQTAEIQTGGEFSFLGKKLTQGTWESLTAKDLVLSFKTGGIVNTFSRKPDALSGQLAKNRESKDRLLVVRMFDDDPSRCTDSFLAQKFTAKVAQGARIVAKAMGARGVAFVVPKKGHLDIDSQPFKEMNFCVVKTDSTKYPAGTKKALISAIRKASRGFENTLFERAGLGGVFLDPETALCVYNSTVLGLPAVESFVHVTGGCLRASGMFKARIGSSVASLAEQCGGFTSSPAKIVVNGLVLGNALASLDVPLTKGVKSLEFLPSSKLCVQKSLPCIRCGKCRAVCPENLAPDLLCAYTEGMRSLPKSVRRTSLLCSQCFSCNSVCPSRLPLCQTIALLKNREQR